MKNLYLKFVAVSCIPLNVLALLVMGVYAHFKWGVPYKTSFKMCYHAQARAFWVAAGNSTKEKEHMDALVEESGKFLARR